MAICAGYLYKIPRVIKYRQRIYTLLCRHTHCVCCRHLLLNLRNICVQETVLSLEQLLRGPSGVPMSSCSYLPGLLAMNVA